MTISSSLNAGVAGLNANATRLAAISDNIANSGTYGYKRASTEFSSMVISSSRGAGLYSAGGVRAATTRLIDERGALSGTSNALDLAVSGRGMLPVVPSTSLDSPGDKPMMMTRTGAFRPDANGVLRTETGLVLLGQMRMGPSRRCRVIRLPGCNRWSSMPTKRRAIRPQR
jgi:flagellar hook protein FlgE